MTVIPVDRGDWLIRVHVDTIEQQGLSPMISSNPLSQCTSETTSGSLLREEEEELDNENGSQGKTNPISVLEAPPVPPSDPTVTVSQKPSSLPQTCVTQQGGRSGGDQVSNGMESHSRAEATTMDKPHDMQDRFGSDDAHSVDDRADEMGERVSENERERASQDMDVDQSNLGDKNYDMAKGSDVQDHVGNENAHGVADGQVEAMGRERALETDRDGATLENMDIDQSNPGDKGYNVAKGKDVQDSIGNEDAHALDGRVDAMGREKALGNESERATQDMDVDQSSPGDKGNDVAKGKGAGLRRSDRKRKTPPPPEREGGNRGKPKPASRKKAKSKEQSLKPALKPEPGRKSRDADGIERNYFEEIEIGGASRLVDMIDLTQDMVSHLSIHTDTLYSNSWQAGPTKPNLSTAGKV
jgi:hypothetical protein